MTNSKIVAGFDDEKNENLQIKLDKVKEVEGCLVLSLTGFIDTYNSSYFQKKIGKAIDAGFIRLIFQCSSLDNVSSSGIRSFTGFQKTVKPKGGDVVLLDIQPKVFEVLQVLGFSQVFNVKDSLDDSVDFFRNGSTAEVAVFPKIFGCPNCSKELKAQKPGRFRCSKCKTILTLDNSGQIVPGQ
jgi:anti-anti-sigma factor